MTKNSEGHEASGAAPRVLTFGSPEIGEILAERYKIEAHVGDDSAGRQLYQGVDVILRRPVMIVLRYPGGDSASEMLAAAVSASRVVHPHLAGVYDAIDEGDRAYVVREWIDGVSLREALADGPLDPGRAVAIAWAVADAVAALHGTGVAHGNVHPGSVMIAPDGRVMLADARADEDATHAGDVRAVAGLLYCALTGFWPHAEAGRSRMPDGIHEADGTFVSPRQIRDDISTELDELIAALLDPQVQPPAAETLAAELAEISDEAEAENLDGALDFAAGFDAVSAMPAAKNAQDPKRRLFLIAAALVVIALVGMIAATQFSGGSDPVAQPSTKASAPKTTKPATNNQPKPLRIAASQLKVIDSPKGSRDPNELVKDVDKMVDGDPNTAWRTQHYNDTADFGGIKVGMGVLIDLGSPQQVAGVQAEMIKAGVTVELKAGDSPTDGTPGGDNNVINTFSSVATPIAAGKTVVFPGPEKPTRYLMIWISRLVPDEGRYQAGIEELSVTVL